MVTSVMGLRLMWDDRFMALEWRSRRLLPLFALGLDVKMVT
jgi:hypothetical protein